MSNGESARRPRKVNARSQLLSEHENELLFTLVGPNGVAQATAVVRAYRSSPGDESYCNQWVKVGTGVAVFVKDSKFRSFYIRIYNLSTKAKFFDEEVHNEFDYECPRWHFHHFTGKESVCGLSFCNPDEADTFKAVY